MAHGCSQASSFKDVPEKLRKAPTDDRVAANAVSVKIRPLLAAFPEVFGTEKGQSLRDQIAHRSRVPGGQFTLWFKPGQPVSVELTGGGERLPLSGDPAKSPGGSPRSSSNGSSASRMRSWTSRPSFHRWLTRTSMVNGH